MKQILLFLFIVSAVLAEAPPDLPLPVASFGAAATENGSVYIYGGHSGTRHKYNRDEVHGDFFHWQAGMAEWEALAKDEPAQGASLVATEKGVIRIGGMAAKNAKGEKQDLWSSETAARYDMADKQWHALPKLPERRSSHDSIVIGETLYVIGGWALLGDSDLKWHNTYLTLDLAKSDATWQTHKQPFECRALAVHFIGTKLYAIGGMDSDEDIVTLVSVLDTATSQWTEGPKLPSDKLGGFGFAAVSHEGRLFASGAAGVLLELRDSGWTPLVKLQHPRFFHRLVSGGKGKLIALGGESRDGKKTSPEVIELPAKDSAPLVEEAPKPKATESKATSLVWPTNLPATESDWPRYQGPSGDCTTPEVGWNTKWPADGPSVLWKAELGKGLGSFSVIGQRVYSAGNDGADKDTLVCLDLDTGKPIWKHSYAVPTKCHEMSIVPYGPASTPTIVGDKAWFISRDGHVLCLNAETGSVLWQKHLVNDLGGKRPVYGYSSSPFIAEDRLYLDVGAGGAGKSNACLKASTGELIWQTGEGEAGYATPLISKLNGKDTLVLFKGQALELRAPADGRLLARHATETRDFCNCATPVVSGDTLFISHTSNMGARVLKADEHALTEVWSDREIGLLFHSGLPVGPDKLLVFNDQVRGANDLRLLDLKSGQSLWKNTEIDKGTGLITAEGHALLLTSKGELVLAQVLTDKLDIQQRVQVLSGKCWVQPVLSHRRLICKNNEGSTVCLDLK
ncbi:MAG: PQQ-binding-like beta-propeller repeat protein [Verrucomicrobia bacterium]|nr:PQQ-binding-like beta-propeller repeat protein [Verrucomicrobiota bacterium]